MPVAPQGACHGEPHNPQKRPHVVATKGSEGEKTENTQHGSDSLKYKLKSSSKNTTIFQAKRVLVQLRYEHT